MMPKVRSEISNELFEIAREMERAKDSDDVVHVLAQLEALVERFRRAAYPETHRYLKECREDMEMEREIARVRGIIPFRSRDL